MDSIKSRFASRFRFSSNRMLGCHQLTTSSSNLSVSAQPFLRSNLPSKRVTETDPTIDDSVSIRARPVPILHYREKSAWLDDFFPSFPSSRFLAASISLREWFLLRDKFRCLDTSAASSRTASSKYISINLSSKDFFSRITYYYYYNYAKITKIEFAISLIPKFHWLKFHRVTRKWGKNRITSDNVISKVKILLEAGNGAIPKNFAFAILRDNNGEIRGGKKARLSTSDRASRRPRWKPRYHHRPPLQNGRSLRLPEAQARNNSKLQIARDTRSALSRTWDRYNRWLWLPAGADTSPIYIYIETTERYYMHLILFDFRKKGRIKNVNSTMPLDLDSYLFFVITRNRSFRLWWIAAIYY